MPKELRLEEHLTPEQSQKLIDYVEHQLQLDVAQFEVVFGYKGNAALVKWLLIYCLFGQKKITFNPDKGFFQSKIPHFELDKSFFNLLSKNKPADQYTIGNHSFGDLISFFTPFFNLGGDGIGNLFFTNFIEKDSDIVFYDHEDAANSYKVMTIDELLQILPIKSMQELTAWIITEKAADSVQNDLIYKKKFTVSNPLLSQDQVFDFMVFLQSNKPLKELMAQGDYGISDTSGIKGEELSGLLTNKESDYYKYDNVRAACNPLIIANFYWYFLTGNYSALCRLLDESKEMKGSYYLAIRNAFVALSQGDFSKLSYAYPDLVRLRKEIDIPESELLRYERTHFKEIILEIERKKEEALTLKAVHSADNYFSLDYGSGITDWALFPVEIKYLQEKPLDAFKAWENPVPIVCTLKNHRQTKGEPQLPADVLPWQTPLGSVSFGVSAPLKNILEQYRLPPHHFYDIYVKTPAKTFHYYAFVLSQTPNDIDYIDFDRTVFYLETSRKPKSSIIGDIKFHDYHEFAERRQAYSLNGFELKFKNKIVYINTDLDIFLFVNSFFISNRLRMALEHNFTGIHFNHLSKFESIMPFTKIIRSEPSKQIYICKNIHDFIGETILDRSIIPAGIQDKIRNEFVPDEQDKMMLVAQKVLEQTWNLPSQQLLDSLLYLAKGEMKNIDHYFPIYDPRDIVSLAKF